MAIPSFVAPVQALSAEDRKSAINKKHPEYSVRSTGWQVHEDAFEGAGGFSGGGYLWKYPAEGTEEFSARQAQARYHNYSESITEVYVRHVFGQGVTRKCTDQAYLDWADNVDGRGATLTDILKRALASGLMTGHTGILVDKTTDVPVGPSRADDRGRVLPAVFKATAILDWRYSGDRLVAVKLAEAAPPSGIFDEQTEESLTAVLVWTLEGWARFTSDGDFISGDTPNLDAVPFVVIRVKPSEAAQMVGRPLLGDPNIIRGIYNRCSEEDEVLRSQAFSVLFVNVGETGDVDATKAALGSVWGASKAIVMKAEADYRTPDQNVPATIRTSKADLVAALYKAAHIRQPKDSAQVETAEAIKLQNAELNDVLVSAARAMAQAERDIARAWFGWTRATPERAQADFDASDFSATYPKQFFLEDVAAELAEIEQAIALNLGPTMTTRLKMRAIQRMDPDMPDEVKTEVEKEVQEASQTPDPLDTGDPEDPNAEDGAAAA